MSPLDDSFSAAWAQQPVPEGRQDGPDGYLRIHAVRVFVRDQERSLRFYLDQLGFKLVFDARLEAGPRWVAVAPPDGGAVLSLIQPRPRTAEYKLIGRATQVVFVTEDVPARFREWHKRGVRFLHTPRLKRVRYERRPVVRAAAPAASAGQQEPVWGGAFTRFEDVDGNSFALVSFDEESRAVEAQRRALAEKRDSERRVAHEMEIARQVQARLFPQTLPLASTLEYAGLCIQAHQVGGDYYDFLNLGQERLGLVIGDIAGKGIAAALLMANLQASLRSQCATALDHPQRFLQAVNQLFCANTIESAYTTLFFAEYDNRAQRLRFANCGHLHGLLLRRNGTLDRLETTATVLGLFEDWDCVIGERQLVAGDVFVLYTDGVTESFNEGGDEFGEQRLVEALRRNPELSSRSMLESIVEDVRRFSPHEQHDDITMIVARCKGN
jgi:serine phosphatase RsbU (regulator of sigma subunit)/catechol 2,3-dioxygenase-like lactoylglutathione lyase family enzyme